jgi:DNA-binding MarR family transcriptional regulator
MSTVQQTAPATTPWLNDSEQHAWRMLIMTTTSLLAVLDNELQAAHGMSLGDYEVLARLSEAPSRTLRMNDLAGQLHLSPSGMTRRIDGLVKAGFVERHQCPTDRRGSNAVLTEAGAAALEAAAPTHVRGVREHLIDRLDEQQLTSLADCLARAEIDLDAARGGCDSA